MARVKYGSMRPRNLFNTPPRARGRNMYNTPQRAVLRGAKYLGGKTAKKYAKKFFRKAGPYARTAALGYGLYQGARSLYQWWRPGLKQRGVSGRVVGRFNRPSSRPKRSDKPMTKGFEHVTEVTGAVSDQTCVYVGHTTYSSTHTLELVGQALLRKLLERALKWRCESITEPIPISLSGNYFLRVDRLNIETGVSDVYNHNLLPGETIYGLCGSVSEGVAPGWPIFMTVMRDYATGGSAVGTTGNILNVIEPTHLELIESPTDRLCARLSFKEEHFHFSCSSQMKIQNRTIAANGDTDTDDVSNSPIEGKLYHFNGGCPKGRNDNMNWLESVYEVSGVIVAGASGLTGAINQMLTEPPNANIWSNCQKSSKQLLNPGEIKTDFITFKTSMPILAFLKRLRVQHGASAALAAKKNIHLMGKCSMIALEDVINLNPLYPINVAYEINRTTSGYLTTAAVKPALGHRYAITQNFPDA